MAALRKNTHTGLLLGICSGLSEWSYDLGYGVPTHVIRVVWGVMLAWHPIGWGLYWLLNNALADTAQCNPPDSCGRPMRR